MPRLVARLKDEGQARQVPVLNTLQSMGPKAASALPAVMAVAETSEGRVRLAAVRAIEAMGAAGEEAIPVLTRALNDGDPTKQVPVEAAAAICVVKSDIEGAVRVFAGALGTEHGPLHLHALRRLREFGSAAAAAIPALTKTAEACEDIDCREMAATLLRAVEKTKPDG